MKIANFPANSAAPALPVHAYFEQNSEALRHAARLLGGYDAMQGVDRIYAALKADGNISRRTRLSLEALRDLLRLENVGDPDRVEMGFFAVIDPSDPVVEEICVLTDGLDSAIAEYVALRQRADPEGASARVAA